MNLITPTYNFVRFGNDKFQLPIVQGDTISFQVRIDDVGSAIEWSVLLKATDNTTAIITDKSIVKEGVVLNVSFFVSVIDVSKTYEIELTYDDDNGLPDVFVSNEFKVMSIQTTVVKYQHFEDFLDFGYETTAVLMNQIRLPFRLYNQIPATVTEQYQKSDGQFVSFGNFINDIYEVETPYLSPQIHKCIQAMFLHRTIETTINSASHYIQLSENYNPEYPDNNNFGLAKGKAKVSVSLAS